MKKLLLTLVLFCLGPSVLHAQNATRLAAAPLAGTNLPKATYLGTGSANTSKTTGAITLTTPTNATMVGIVVIGCSGNFATSNWTAAVTDSASNTYVQLGANSGTYPQANSTTQVCVPFFAKNTGIVTTITFTIAGSNSANTTVSLMAWGVSNIIPSLSAIDGWASGTGSAATALSTQVLIPSHSNELAIIGGCASTGTITLPTTSALSFDSGSVAIASGTNCVTAYGGSVFLNEPVGVTGSFTDGSSAAFSEVVILLKGFVLTDSGSQHQAGNTISSVNVSESVHPTITAPPPTQAVTSLAASGSTASCSVSAVPGRARIITGWAWGVEGDSTGAAAQLTFNVKDNTLGLNIFQAYVNNPSGVGAIGGSGSITGVSFPVTAGSFLLAAFTANVAHALEYCALWYYDVDVPNITY